jgi:hypothetical protein
MFIPHDARTEENGGIAQRRAGEGLNRKKGKITTLGENQSLEKVWWRGNVDALACSQRAHGESKAV